VLAAAAAERKIPAPTNLAAPGCVLFLVSLGLFALVPRIGADWLGGNGGPLRFLAFALIVAGIFTGLALFFFFGSGRGQLQARERAEAAIESLSTIPPDAARDDLLSAAVRLVLNSLYTRGSWTRPTIDVETAREALGDLLPLVESVERVLVTERHARPVFTQAQGTP
jgi:hypothetical protein